MLTVDSTQSPRLRGTEDVSGFCETVQYHTIGDRGLQPSHVVTPLRANLLAVLVFIDLPHL